MKHTEHYVQISNSWVLLIFFSVLLVIYSCKEPDPFPTIPSISFKDLRFVKTTENNTLDSLILEFNFEDGDGDLGLDDDDSSPPYNDVSYVVDSLQEPVALNGNHPTPFSLFTPQNGGTLNTQGTTFGSFEFFSETDNRPSYSCQDYDTLSYFSGRDDTSPNPDTLFVVRNEFRFNLYVKFFWDLGEGFEELDFEFFTSQFGCGENFNGRFPIWDASNIGTSLQGSIKYSMVSSGFELTLRDRPFKIQFYIYDRALNRSVDLNKSENDPDRFFVETPVFLLSEITEIQ